MYKICLILIAVVQNGMCYYMPLHKDMGKSLEPLMDMIRDTIVFLPDIFPKPEPVAKKPFYSPIVEYVSELYSTPKVDDEAMTKPLLICNSFVLVTLISIFISYIMFAKKYFATSATSDVGLQFMEDEDMYDNDTDFLSSQSTNDVCYNCKLCSRPE